MELVAYALVAFAAGLVGGVLVDIKFWWRFAQEVYYHQPGNHRCARVSCCG